MPRKTAWITQKEEKLKAIKQGVRELNLKNYSEYEKIRKIKNLPSRPEIEFADYGWKGWVDFLGCETKLAMFARIKKEVQEAKISSYSEYEMVRNEKGWPSRPERGFAGYGWKGWENFFGKKLPERKLPTTPKTRIPFSFLKEQVLKLCIQKFEDYAIEAKKHADWPSNPNVYEEYTSFEEFAETKPKYIPLGQLRNEVKQYHIIQKGEYKKIRKEKKLFHWPPYPESYYKADWKNWGDLVGKELAEPIKKAAILPYVILKYFVQQAGITSSQQYEQERKKHTGWVSNPYRHYKKTGEWISYPDLFGTK